MAEMTHAYVSTYCQHNQHDQCRLECKTCAAPCLCTCHQQHDDHHDRYRMLPGQWWTKMPIRIPENSAVIGGPELTIRDIDEFEEKIRADERAKIISMIQEGHNLDYWARRNLVAGDDRASLWIAEGVEDDD